MAQEKVGSMVTVCVMLLLWSLLIGIFLVYRKKAFDCRTNQAIQCWNDWQCWNDSSTGVASVGQHPITTPTNHGSAIPGGTGYAQPTKTSPTMINPNKMYTDDGLLNYDNWGVTTGCSTTFPPFNTPPNPQGSTPTADNKLTKATCMPQSVTSDFGA